MNCTRLLGNIPQLPHQQILFKRDHRMHRGYQKSQCQHILNSQSDLWILANATGWKFTTPDGFHNFTIPGRGQFHWITSPMGLLGCPESFQWLMEGVLRDIKNLLVYIDDLLVHTDTHEKHLQGLIKCLPDCIKTTSKLTWTNVCLETRKFPILDLLSLQKESNQARTNWRLSGKPNFTEGSAFLKFVHLCL